MDVTLRDIARRAAVSTSTVSRVLNDYPHVAKAVRATVWQAAEELGYPLSHLRRTPQVRRTVLLIGGYSSTSKHTADVSVIGREFMRLVLVGAQSIFESQGISTRLQNNPLPAGTVRHSAYSEDPGVAGLILLGGNHKHYDTARQLQAVGMPAVIAGGGTLNMDVNCVMANYMGGMEQAVAHLTTNGRRCIGLVNGASYTTTSKEKYKGFRLALSLQDLAFAPVQVVADAMTSEQGYTQTLHLLTQKPQLDAIIYADDYMAMGGLRALKESGRRVPEDVAIIGFHDYEIAGFTDPPLTSVRFDMSMMGVIAARRIIALLAEPNAEPWFVVIPTSLVVRESA